MTHWAGLRTTALVSAESSLKTVDNLLSFVKEGQGKPSAKERAIFAASVVFLYGIWENYVEQLALELVGHICFDTARAHSGIGSKVVREEVGLGVGNHPRLEISMGSECDGIRDWR